MFEGDTEGKELMFEGVRLQYIYFFTIYLSFSVNFVLLLTPAKTVQNLLKHFGIKTLTSNWRIGIPAIDTTRCWQNELLFFFNQGKAV